MSIWTTAVAIGLVDPQTDLRISLETAAKMRVQALMRSGEVEYVWSDALDYELNQSPIRLTL